MVILPNLIAMYGLLYTTECINSCPPPPQLFYLPVSDNYHLGPTGTDRAPGACKLDKCGQLSPRHAGVDGRRIPPIHATNPFGIPSVFKVMLSWLSMALTPDRYSLDMWRSSHPHDYQRFAGFESCRVNNVVVMATYLPVFCMSASSSDRI